MDQNALAHFDFSVPVIVAGGGACGTVAALAAREAGAEVLLIERDAGPGGCTAMSQGLICAAGTEAQRRHGIEDSPDILFNDILVKTRGLTDPAIARTIADGAGPCIEWLIDRHDLPYDLDLGFRAAYGHSQLRVHGWPGRSGVDLIQFLHSRVAAADIPVLFGALLDDIIEGEGGQVVGVQLRRPDGAIERIGCEALVLATSGFAANPDMVARFIPEMAGARHNGHEGNTGSGIALGARLGGALADMGSYQGYGMLTDPAIPLPPGLILEGGILLNRQGRRFIDETRDISGMVHPVLAQPGGFVWAVYDAAIEGRCAYVPETQQLMALNTAKIAPGVAELAEVMDAPLDAVQAALDAVYAARTSADGQDPMGRAWLKDEPPTAPFRAARVQGALFHTQGGLQIDGQARVLRADGSRLPNLYAGGGAARGVTGPASWGYLPAMGLCAAVTLGRIAGRAAALQVGSEAL